MADYLAIYEQGIPYFEEELQQVMLDIDRRQSTVFCTAYKMGDRRFLDYLNYALIKEHQYTVLYDKENSLSKNQLLEFQKLPSAKPKVLLLPWFWRMNKQVIKEFIEIFRDKRQSFTSAIILEADFLDHPERVFPDTNELMQVVRTRNLLTVEQTRQFLQVRELLADQQIAQTKKDSIRKLAFGHIGLSKRLFLLAQQGANFELDDLLTDPAIRTDLLNLEHQLQTLTQQTLRKIGLIGKQSEILIPLLARFVEKTNQTATANLPPIYQQLLALFRSKNGGIVTKEEIHLLLGKEKTYSLWAVYKTVSRFSEAIKPLYEIRNVSGKGYTLVSKST